MVPVALAFALFQQGAGPGRVSAVLAAEALPLVVLTLFGGVLADRYTPRYLMILADGLRAIAQLLLALLLFVETASFSLTIILVSIVGIGGALDAPGRNRFLTQLVPFEVLPRANGVLMIAVSLSGLVGPALGGAFVATSGAAWAIALDSLSYIASALMLMRVKTEHRPFPQETSSSLLKDLREGWSEFKQRRWVWLMVCFFAILHTLSWAPLEVLGALRFAHLPKGALHWGGIMSMMGAGAALGGVISLKLRPERPVRAILFWLLLYPLSPLCLSIALPYWAQLACFFVGGMEMANVNVLWESTLQRAVPAEKLSRVSAYDSLGSFCLLPLGYALAGPLALLLGVTNALFLGGLLILILTILLLSMPFVREVSGSTPQELNP